MDSDLSRLTKEQLAELEATLQEGYDHYRYRRFAHFEPYEKQRLFFEMGAFKRERLLMAGNQLGKTEAGAYETSLHLTGEYPSWWRGRRFDHPVAAWAAGETSVLVRDGQQKKLCGTAGVVDDFGTGFIPRDAFVDKPSLARGVTDAFDTIQVRHKPTGGVSTLGFKSYEQGREKFQSATLDFVWCDEEPNLAIYSECLTRVTATGGMLFMTFTPLKGMSTVVMRYLNEPSPDRGFIVMVIDDAKHIPPEERAKIIAGYPAHEREARARGIPMLGSGRIFQYPEELIREPRIEFLPTVWTKLWSIDFGIDHPFAAVLQAWDRDADVIHVLHALRMSDGGPLQHAVPMKMVAVNVPVAWPHDGHQRDKGSGDEIAPQYKQQGLLMLPTHATWEDGGYSVEAGLMEMGQRMETARYRVAEHLAPWFEEFRMYHRKDGQIVKEHDDLMSASRVGVMAKRFGRAVNLGSVQKKRRPQEVADGVDFPIF